MRYVFINIFLASISFMMGIWVFSTHGFLYGAMNFIAGVVMLASAIWMYIDIKKYE